MFKQDLKTHYKNRFMKKILVLILLATSLLTKAQSPQLTVKDKDSVLVKMSQMLVSVKIVGNIAYTTAEMHFTNKSKRQMEAELLFPLPEGVSVSRYAIDLNGKMREAVPVNKEKGKQVFEVIEHRNVDPGLLERVEGNNFKTRIYPILPNKERIVLIGYEQELSFFDKNNLAYQVLSKYPYALEKYEINIKVVDASTVPTATNENIKWSTNNETKIQKTNHTPNENWMIKIPITQDAPSILMKTGGDKNYFYSNIFIENNKIIKQTPASIGIIWDNSLSCKNKDVQKEIGLLDSYFKSIKNIAVTLYNINYFFTKEETFTIKNGEWSSLKTKLENTVYDGGTRFSKINVGKHDEYLFFTDGLSSMSETNISTYKKPTYTITSSASADFAYLNFNAQKTAANFINLNQVDAINALDKLLNQSLRFLGLKENNSVSEIYPMVGTPVTGSISIAGISTTTLNEIVLLFGYGNTATIEKKITLDADKQSSDEVNIEKLWAQKKITNLEYQYNKYADEIEMMGKQYGIITQGTSLIVLESINDYLMYDIMPPLELRPEWDRIKKQRAVTELATQKNNWRNIDNYFLGLSNWWNKNIQYHAPKPQPVPIARKKNNGTDAATEKNSDQLEEVVVVGALGTQRSQRLTVSTTTAGYNNDISVAKPANLATALQGRVAGVQVSSKSAAGSYKLSVPPPPAIKSIQFTPPIIKKDEEVISGDFVNFDSTRTQIATTSWSPDRNYLKILKDAITEKKYTTYIELREKEINNPNFYFDVAHYFYDRGDKEKALLVLSNIADLGSENHQLYKTLSFTLRQWQATEDAVFTTNKIAQWRAFEPQSHRDYALALEDNKQYQAAFDECIKALEVNYFGEMSGHYEGVEDILLMDMNRMMQEHTGINTSKLDKKYAKKMPVDVRIILNWNQMDVDIDMHVLDPNKDECYYANKTTKAGARFSKDFTQGYGPEQYILRNAIKGKYIITSNFYGETTLTENGPATVMVEIYTTKKDGTIERKIKTIQASDVKENGALAEIVIE